MSSISIFSANSSVVRTTSSGWCDFMCVNGVFSIPDGGTSTPLFTLASNGIIIKNTDVYEIRAIVYSSKQTYDNYIPIKFSRKNHGLLLDIPDMYFNDDVYIANITGMSNDLIIIEAANSTIGFSIRRQMPRQLY